MQIQRYQAYDRAFSTLFPSLLVCVLPPHLFINARCLHHRSRTLPTPLTVSAMAAALWHVTTTTATVAAAAGVGGVGAMGAGCCSHTGLQRCIAWSRMSMRGVWAKRMMSSSSSSSTAAPLESVLIANRGEIACRVGRTARRMGMRVLAVYSDADARAPHVRMADEARRLGPPPSAESYLKVDHVLGAIKDMGAASVRTRDDLARSLTLSQCVNMNAHRISILDSQLTRMYVYIYICVCVCVCVCTMCGN